MTKVRSVGQKKEFFSHPKNRNTVFGGRREEPREEQDKPARSKGMYSVLSTEGRTDIPSCSHGPCLLFGQGKNRVIVKKFFACAVYRDNPEECAFKCELLEDGTLGMAENRPFPLRVGERKPWNYGTIPKKLKDIKLKTELLFCRLCTDVFVERHRCPCEPVTRKQLKNPSRLLESLESHSGEAQFFFSDEALSVLTNAIDKAGIDGVLCIGAPRLFETLKNQKLNKKNIFLLDFDRRYAHFYQSLQYGQYSMLVDHFYDSKTEQKLKNFLAKCSSLLIVCDPPFGVILDPLLLSIKSNVERYIAAREGQEAKVNTAYVVPFFLDKHIIKPDNGFWMFDYRVTYDNHKNFSKSSRSSVRIISDIDKSAFDMTGVPGYKHCELCEVYVAEDNTHCYMCMKCVSRDGSKYHHCDRCMRCVKDAYSHCRLCHRCHLMGRGCPRKTRGENAVVNQSIVDDDDHVYPDEDPEQEKYPEYPSFAHTNANYSNLNQRKVKTSDADECNANSQSWGEKNADLSNEENANLAEMGEEGPKSAESGDKPPVFSEPLDKKLIFKKTEENANFAPLGKRSTNPSTFSSIPPSFSISNMENADSVSYGNIFSKPFDKKAKNANRGNRNFNSKFSGRGDRNSSYSRGYDRNSGYSGGYDRNSSYSGGYDRNANYSGGYDRNANYSDGYDRNSNFASRGDRNSNFASRGDRNSNFSSRGDRNSNFSSRGDRNSNFSSRGDRSSNFSSRGDRSSNFSSRGDRSSNFSNRGDSNSKFSSRGGREKSRNSRREVGGNQDRGYVNDYSKESSTEKLRKEAGESLGDMDFD